jgi:pimeloyl-ACP methyl ester carboxylesterase/DNA-binding SARP family transcriptional activator
LDIVIKVLGEFSVYRDGAAISLPQSRKTRALLAYLAVLGKPQRRERLCELFWDVPDDPRGALRWSLSKLRQALNADGEERLQADRNLAHLKPGTFVLDYELIRGLSSESIGGLTTERLQEIAAAFTGPFLVDLYLPHCSAFEAWRVYCSNEIEILHLKTLRTLIDRLGDEPERALAYVHTLQTLLPDENFANEITRINERARQTAATNPVIGAVSTTLTESAVRPVAEAAAGLPSGNLPAVPSLGIGARKQSIHHAHSNDGTRIAYAVSGSGPAIVRASHWMSHLDFDWESPVWGHWIDALSDGFTLLRYDGRLNGLSGTTAQDISLDAFIADLECVVDAAGIKEFILLGISQGCAISVEFAARHPERVAGLLLYGGYIRGWRARGDANEIGRREAIAALIRQGWGQADPMFRQLFTNLFIPGANRVQMDWFNELERRTLTPENAWRLSNAFADIDVSARLNALRLPTLVLHARGDRVAPLAGGLELSSAIRGARFVELDSSNHILLAEEPAFQEFVREAIGFASQVYETKAIVPIDNRTRRQATILCADFVCPVQAMDEFFPETALEIIDPLLMKAVELVRANGGTVLSVTDSELTASFGAPDGLEGHAALACRTALKLRETVLNDLRSMIRVRIALDTGVVIVGPARVAGAGALEVRGGPVTVAAYLGRRLCQHETSGAANRI